MPTARVAQATPHAPVTLHVGGVEWSFAVAAVTRVGRDLFIQVQLAGPEMCGVTVHLRDRVIFGVTAEGILRAACEWLQSRGAERHGYVELSDASWMQASVA